MDQAQCLVTLGYGFQNNSKGNDVALAFNKGYLCSYFIKKLLNFTADVEEDAYELAKLFVEAGLEVPQAVYVGVFEKFNVEFEEY